MTAANRLFYPVCVVQPSGHGTDDGRRSENKTCYTGRTGADPDEGADPQSRVEKEKNDDEG